MNFTTSILIIAIIAIITSSIATYLWRRRHLYAAARQFKGPLALPIIGSAWLFICKNEEILMRIYDITTKYTSMNQPIKFWLGPILSIVLLNPDHVEKILCSSKFAHKHDIYKFVKIFLGEGLISASGSGYKKHKRIIQPMFDLNFVKETSLIFKKYTDLCMEKLEEYVGKDNLNFNEIVHECMADFIKDIILGSNHRSQLKGLSDFDHAMVEAYNFVFTRLAKPYLQPAIIFNMTPYKKEQNRLLSILRNEGKKSVQDSYNRRKQIKTSNDFCPIVDRIANFMQDNPDVISEEEFVDHLLTLHAASSDTLTIITEFLALCLGMYPEYQEKAAKEIRDIFGDTPRCVTFEDIEKLNYVDMCIKDVLRLFPVAPIILRKCTGDFQIENYLIPKDCAVVVPIFTLHRDERYWENPHHFHPDHFLPEVANKRHIFAYIPFSAGSRGCIGKLLAHTGLKIFICALLQRFEIEADGKLPDLELKMDISTRPKNGYHLRLKKRVWK